MKQILFVKAWCCLLLLATIVRAQEEEEEFQHGPLTAEYIKQFTEDVVQFHNLYRAAHGQDALVFNTTMGEIAQREAERLFNLRFIEMHNPELKDFSKNFARAITSQDGEYTGMKIIIQQ
jgi:uncharacterized protein YkwD